MATPDRAHALADASTNTRGLLAGGLGTSRGREDAGDGDANLSFGQRIIFCHFVSLWGTF
jgi:hypothetical protein